MKRILYIPIFLTIGVVLYVGIQFYWNNFRGLRPAFGPSPKIPKMDTVKPAENSTGLPFSLAPGFSISIFSEDLASPRVMVWDPDGVMLVSIPSQGKVLALPDRNHDRVADFPVVVASGLNRPHGLAFREGKLYIAETDGVSVFDYDLSTNRATRKKLIISLPGGGNHYSRTIGFGPDGKLYVSIGSSCNVCVEKDSRRAAILVSNADGSELREYATGLRNSVFFTWHPKTREMWATDMGRDLLGDNTPAEEINIVRDGGFYGWPFCYEDRVHDKNFDPSGTSVSLCARSIAPHIQFQAHSAPLGLAFIPENWPEQYRGNLLVAFHGSWNKTEPTGYKIVLFKLGEQSAFDQTDFLSGFLVGSGAFGRPVDLLFKSDGDLYISDDKAGNIYRVSLISK